MPQWAEYSTGERIKILRGERTQDELAHLAGLSPVRVRRAEQDVQLTLPTLLALSDALSADVSVILGQQAPRRGLGHEDRQMLRRLSHTVHDTAAGILQQDDEAPTVAELRAAVDRCWDLYWDGRYAEAGAVAAPLVRSAAARLHDQPDGARAGAHGLLADAYRVAAYVSNLLGQRDLAYTAIGHARSESAAAADDLRQALVDSGRAWIYLRDARLPDALRLAEKAAADIEPRFSRATVEQLTVYGSHVNFAAVVASRMGDKERSADLLSQSHAAGARMGGEHRAHGTLFGPVSATTQAVGINVALGKAGQALDLAGSVTPDDEAELSQAAQRRYALDRAMAQADTRRWDDALDTLEEALTASPEWARHQALPQVIVDKVGRASTARLRRVSTLIGARETAPTGFATATSRTAL
ncbi:helix-turn-helix domain-containing protein [Streptomyces daliensis]|uniref:Helix-turn-helix transcriptional regulator n=1 Tax=Streptomyces daliensis TaxID=299421 RepID=A0A8T4ITH0_9ACTN|nr:helix-turn-helix transcriptional regulator [Streptomyces daliensis]